MALRIFACAVPRLCSRIAIPKPPAVRPANIAMQSASILCEGNAADELAEALMSFGASSCSIEGATQDTKQDGPEAWQTGPRQLWKQSCITALFGADVDVPECLALASDALGLKQVPEYKLKAVEETDWVEQVKDSFQPVQVFPKFYIVPQWCTPPDSEATNIILDPGLAFGTGEHPTTSLCLKWLRKCIRGGENVLDYGTGSGVLSIAALKMGASHAVGIDIDPVAVSSASSNAALNNLEPHSFEAFIAPENRDEDPVPSGPGSFDVVVANILLNPLVNLSGRIPNYARVGGFVGLSGIIVEQVERVVETYSTALTDIEVAEEDGWACVCGTRK